MSDAIACADGSSLCDLPEEVACEPFSCSKLDIPDFIKTVNVGKSLHLNSQVILNIYIVSGYTKIFRHDIKGGFFANYEEAGNKNPDDEDADLFSILDTLDFFRGVDGKFLFKLCYPEFEGSNGGHCNEWYQTSNPFTESEITGFEKVKTEFELQHPGQTEVFKGLGKNSPDSGSAGNSAISNNPLMSHWMMAIGAYKGIKQNSGIPGPVEAIDQGQAITVVELFASKARVNPSAGVGLSGALTVRCDEPGEDLDIGYNLKEVHLTCTRE